MATRYITAALMGAGITTSLLWIMHFLIEETEAAVDPIDDRGSLVFVRIPINEDVFIKEHFPEPPRDPAKTPPLTPPVSNDSSTTPIGFRHPTTAPQGPVRQKIGLGSGNSALVNIIHAQPEYPIVASSKNLEGYVIVQFDVTVAGTVENVTVVETSSRLFNKSAVKAAYRSRYKPKMLDGAPQRTSGLRKMFRFEMEH